MSEDGGRAESAKSSRRQNRVKVRESCLCKPCDVRRILIANCGSHLKKQDEGGYRPLGRMREEERPRTLITKSIPGHTIGSKVFDHSSE